MTKIVTRLISSSIDADSFAAKPKTMYLAGEKYARVEEELDSEHGIHGLIITNEPDTWIINLADKTGRHVVDPGPTFVIHSPIFWTALPKGQSDPDKDFKDLEFGKEAQFFQQHGGREIGTRDVDGKNCKATTIKSGLREVTLLLDPKTGKPHQIDISKDGKMEASFRYIEYTTGLPFQKLQFEPPKEIKITEPNARKAGYVGVFGRYEDLVAWAQADNENSQQFTEDLRKARNARDVASALKESARRQQKTTEELARLVRAYPELRNAPQLGLDQEGLRMWEQKHPDAKTRRANVPPEVAAISEQMHRFNTTLDSAGRDEAINMLRKYNANPEVVSAAKELSQTMAENRRRLLQALQ